MASTRVEAKLFPRKNPETNLRSRILNRMKKENRPRLRHDMEENMLSRLPVKTILRFMSVCKSWYSLFLNPYFIKIHHKNSTNNSSLLLMRLYVRDELVVMDSCSSVVHSRLFIRHQLCSFIQDEHRNIVGSCNGIVCIHGLSHRFGGRFDKDYICLWNPALRIIKYVLTNYTSSSERMFIGFGFDSHSNDYKVLRFHKSIVGAYQQVEIYSLSSDSWRTVEGARAPPNIRDFFMRSYYHSRESGVYVNQTHHWVVCHRKSEPKPWSKSAYNSAIIVSFDMRKEAFKETIVPTECMEKECMSMILFNYNECLAMLTFTETRHEEFDFHDIWVMKDYGLPQSWTKLCKINKGPVLPRTIHFRGFTETKNGLIFSSDVRQPIVFDTSWSEVKNPMIFKDAMEVMDFRESLGLLNSKNLVHYEEV